MGSYELISEEAGAQYGFGKYPVTVIPHVLVPASDGVRLAVKFWFPSKTLQGAIISDGAHHVIYDPRDASPSRPQPVIMEYIPYRKSDGTLVRDHRRLTWFASHGYVCARVDMRGSGDSEGTYHDEYLAQEQKDACDMIAWFSEQAWCDGNVGMYGKSWSGINGLQVAYEQPPALKAVISLYSTDDRYASDIHYMGGCIPANLALWTSSCMFTLNAAPPHPSHVPNWRSTWRQRLEEASEPMVHDWFSHQTKDGFWQHGSVCENPSRLKCPVLLIGGLNDGYRDTVFSGIETFPNVRGIVGPWCHNWPDVGTPGPAIAFTEECLKWWDCHLKGLNNGAMDVPLLRAFIQESFLPDPDVNICRKGSWVSDTMWPPTSFDRWLCLLPDNNTGMLQPKVNASGLKECSSDVSFEQCSSHGEQCGEWWFVSTNSLPADQRLEDAKSLCWTTGVLEQDISILGLPVLELTLAIDSNAGNVAVRICDVFPDGKSTLVTWGLLNLAHRDGHDLKSIKPLVPGELYKVKITCLTTGYTVPKGHRLRVAVAPTYWPLLWPSCDPVTLAVTTGHETATTSEKYHTRLLLPVYNLQTSQASPVSFPPANPSFPEPEVNQLRPPSYRRYVETDVSSRHRCFVLEEDSGKSQLYQTGTIMGSKFVARYSMEGEDPLSAKVDIDYLMEYEYPEIEGGIHTEIQTFSHMEADKEVFYFAHELEVKINQGVFFSKKWEKDIPRQNV